jgi:two-component system LytT family sensor kinase
MFEANLISQFFCLTVTLALLICRHFDHDLRRERQSRLMNRMLQFNTALLICCILCALIEGRADLEPLLNILTFGRCGLGHPLAGLYAEYAICTICDATPKSERPQLDTAVKYVRIITCVSWGSALILNLISMGTPLIFSCFGGHYVRGSYFWLNQLLGATDVIPAIILLFLTRRALGKRRTISLLCYPILPCIAIMVQFPIPEYDITSISTTLALVIIYVAIYVDRGYQLIQQEQDLMESRVSVLLSQIQPHFLYNALAIIQDLCHHKAPEAEETTIEFSEFLRANIDSLKLYQQLIPFERELDHTRNYLALEAKRFGDLLQVDYLIEATDFRLPPLTLQPLVENAVRWGVMQKEDGGRVTIRSWDDGTRHCLSITDNGIGFNTRDIPEDRVSGITGIRERLKRQCGGSLTLESVPGAGSSALITIPFRQIR